MQFEIQFAFTVAVLVVGAALAVPVVVAAFLWERRKMRRCRAAR